MTINLKNILLPLIFVLATLLRFSYINQIPSLNPDEAALGYNAHSLIKTGKDEHGASWPLHFKSFGDFKPGGYVYLDLPFTALFGLTPLGTRLPNLILSVLAIMYLYKLVFILSKNNKLALLSALTLTISPWHIHFSRGAWESSAALTFILIGIFHFYKYIYTHKIRHFFIFILFIVASFYTYHSARLVAPLLSLVLIMLYSKILVSNFKTLIFPIFFGIIITIPVLLSFLNNGGTTRLGGVGLMADYGPIARAEELLNQHSSINLSTRIIHNKYLLYIVSWSEKYLSHFDLNFLFTQGDEVPRSKTPNMGQLYLIELPLLFLGIYFLFNSKIFTKKTVTFILLFTLISPIASSLTFQAPSALRSLPLVIPLSIFTSLGLYQLLKLINKLSRNKKYLGFLFITILYFTSLTNYLNLYFIYSPKVYPFAWNSKFEEIIPYINSQKDNFQNVYLTDTYDQPYILYLYFSQYNPQKIQSQIILSPPDKFGFSTVRQIDNIYFQNLTDYSSLKSNSLIINDSDTIPNVTPIKIINFTNGQPAFKIYTK